MHTLAFLPNLGGFEWAVLLVLGLLIFGKRLPEVGKSLGRGIVEFRKGVQGLQDEVETEVNNPKPNPYAQTPSPVENTVSSGQAAPPAQPAAQTPAETTTAPGA